MQNAIEVVFPDARHRWCLWHIMKKLPEKLGGYTKYDDIRITLLNVIYDLLSKDDFDKGWINMIDGFGLHDNEWLGGLYNDRHLWAPAFFDGYVNSTTTLKQFVEQYDNALRDKVEKENRSDCKSFQEVIPCITHYEFEKQFQATYTNAKFKEFQDELRGKIYCYPNCLEKEGSNCTFKVREDRKVGEKMIVSEFIVLFNKEEGDMRCECRRFEF
jgi:hypothetical protein